MYYSSALRRAVNRQTIGLARLWLTLAVQFTLQHLDAIARIGSDKTPLDTTQPVYISLQYIAYAMAKSFDCSQEAEATTIVLQK